MTHTDLIARLRLKGIQPNEKTNHNIRRMEVERIEAANALTAAQERIEALEGVLRRVSTFPIPRGFGVTKQPSADAMRTIARAALDATDNT